MNGSNSLSTAQTQVYAHQVTIGDELHDPEWDAFVARIPGGNVVQLSLWAQVKASLRWRAHRIIVRSDRGIRAGVQLLTHSYPLVGGIGYVTKGPLCEADDPSALSLILKTLLDLCNRLRVRYLVVQPPNNGADSAVRLPQYGFRPEAFNVSLRTSLVVNVALDDSALLSQMNATKRRHIRVSERNGIVVREGTAGDLGNFYDLYASTTKRHGAIPYRREYINNMYARLAPHGFLKIFMAELGSEAVSTAMVSTSVDALELRYLGWSGLHRESFPSDALFWGIFRWARGHGYRSYDLGGIDPSSAAAVLSEKKPPEEVLKSWSWFKLGFGGQVVNYPQAFCYIPSPILRYAYELFSRNKGLVRKVYKFMIRSEA